MWELDHKEGWVPKNGCLWIVLEKTLESPLDSKEIKPVNPKGNQHWIFSGRTEAKVEAPMLWPLDANSQLTGKDLDVCKAWKHKAIEDEMVMKHHWLNGYASTKLWEIVTDRKAWHAAICGVAKSQTWLSDSITTITKRWGRKFLTQMLCQIATEMIFKLWVAICY